MLVDRGANINVRDNVSAFGFLLASGCSLHPPAPSGCPGTPMRVTNAAAHSTSCPTTSQAGATAVMYAAGRGHESIVSYLMEHGADPALWDAVRKKMEARALKCAQHFQLAQTACCGPPRGLCRRLCDV